MSRFTAMACLALLGLCCAGAQASEIVYKPINPSFGGNPLNGNFLLQKGQLQNDNDDGSGGSFLSDPFSDFEDTLNRRLLGDLSQGIVAKALGSSEGAIADGTYTVGYLQITVEDLGTFVRVSLTNLNTGETSVVEVPVIQTTTTIP